MRFSGEVGTKGKFEKKKKNWRQRGGREGLGAGMEGDLALLEALEAELAAAAAAPPVLARGQEVLYSDARTGAKLPARIDAVHHDDGPPYYTVRFADGALRDTEASRLEAVGAAPADDRGSAAAAVASSSSSASSSPNAPRASGQVRQKKKRRTSTSSGAAGAARAPSAATADAPAFDPNDALAC